jgi:CheY-like chemotaxis protein
MRRRKRRRIFLSGTSIVLRILVVDDDPLICGAIVALLQRPAVETKVAYGREPGIRALAASTFDLMLVDIFMPHTKGYESIRIFHELAPAIPLIAMSGRDFAKLSTSSHDFLRTILELGATRFLRKPFTPATLMSAVNESLVAPKRAARP